MSFAAEMVDHLEGVLSVGPRIFPGKLPQHVDLEDGDALVYQFVPSDGPLVTHDGDAGVTTVRCQFSTWSSTYDGAEALADELRRELSGRRFTWGPYEVGHVLLDSGLDDVDERTGDRRRIVDAAIQYSGGADGS